MPKIKEKLNDENIYPLKPRLKKKKAVAYKFDINQILKDRIAKNKYWERSAELDKQIKVVDALFEKEVLEIADIENKEKEYPVSLESGYVVFDSSKYNVMFKINEDSHTTKSYLLQLFLMSIEENVLAANIHFINLMKANWSPAFDVC